MRSLPSVLMILATSMLLAAQTAPTDGTIPTPGLPLAPVGGPMPTSSSVSCAGANWTDAIVGTTGVAANFALLANSGAGPIVVCGVELFCCTVSGNTVTMNVDLYDRPTAAAPGASLGTTTMTVGGAVGPYACTFVPPIVIPAATDFFLVFDNRVGLRLPIVPSGTTGTHYFNGPPTWNGPFNTQRWNYRVLCCGDLESGVYSQYGAGCRGTGSGSCLATNQSGPFGWTVGAAANFALLANSGASQQLICSVDLFCCTTSGIPNTTSVSIYDRPVPGGPPGVAIASTTMNVSGIPAVNNAAFSPPVIITPGTDYFIVFDNRVGLRIPSASSGGTLETHYWNGPPTWNGPFTTTRWIYSVNCCGSGAVPVLNATGRPRLGATFNVNLAKGAPGAPALLFTGFSNTSWLGLNLPFDMTVAGAPGCNLLAPGAFILVSAANSNGDASIPFALPGDPTLFGGHAYQQWLVYDPTVNALGFVFSQAGDARLGD